MSDTITVPGGPMFRAEVEIEVELDDILDAFEARGVRVSHLTIKGQTYDVDKDDLPKDILFTLAGEDDVQPDDVELGVADAIEWLRDYDFMIARSADILRLAQYIVDGEQLDALRLLDELCPGVGLSPQTQLKLKEYRNGK